MRQLLSVASQFRDDETGAAMVEYSILIAIIAGVAILAIIAIGLWSSGRLIYLCGILDGRMGGKCTAASGTGS